MRPINLIPVEERRGSHMPMRGGATAYILLAGLLIALIGVTLLVNADSQISDNKVKVAQLEEATVSAEAEAARLAPYTQFHEVRSQRTTTVSNLADSRFDWDRVMRQLALVLPNDIRLTNLTGTVRPDVTVNNAESVSLRESIAGPALTMVGCAAGQEAVAQFVTVLKDIDGVTRVGVQSSTLPQSGEEGAAVSATGGGCQTQNSTALFQIVVAFDAAPIPAAALGTTEVTAPAPEEAASSEAAPAAAKTEETATEGN